MSFWSFQLYFIPQIPPTSLRSLTLFSRSYFCLIGPFNYIFFLMKISLTSDIILCERRGWKHQLTNELHGLLLCHLQSLSFFAHQSSVAFPPFPLKFLFCFLFLFFACCRCSAWCWICKALGAPATRRVIDFFLFLKWLAASEQVLSNRH